MKSKHTESDIQNCNVFLQNLNSIAGNYGSNTELFKL